MTRTTKKFLGLVCSLSLLSPIHTFADDDNPNPNPNPDPTIGVKPPTNPIGPSPGGDATIVPEVPKDPPPGKQKMPSRDKVHLSYKDYTLSASFSGGPEAAHIVLSDPDTDLLYTADFDTDTTSVYLPMQPGNYNVALLTASNKTYRGVLILE